MQNSRVVITGLGVISSIGIGKDKFWDALIQGRSGISRITGFDTSCYQNHNAGQVRDFEPLDFISKERAATMGRASCLGIAAARLAASDARLRPEYYQQPDIGIVMGTTMGESQVIEGLNDAWVRDGHQAIDADWIPRYPCNVIAANIAMEFGAKGPNFTIPCACAAGNYAIGYASDLIRTGRARMMLAGGSDAFSRLAFMGFNRLFAVAGEICQPFDKNRKGMMVGEGAAVLVLESLDEALSREAPIYAEVAGYGLSCDAHHMTAPFAEGIAQAIKSSIDACAVKPEEVDYISAHGTGTASNDKEECLAIKKVFGERRVAASSIKSMLGHTMGAASAIEALACCLVITGGVIPPTINYKTPDPECDIDCVPNTARKADVRVAINNASAFGGNNSCLVLKKYPPN